MTTGRGDTRRPDNRGRGSEPAVYAPSVTTPDRRSLYAEVLAQITEGQTTGGQTSDRQTTGRQTTGRQITDGRA